MPSSLGFLLTAIHLAENLLPTVWAQSPPSISDFNWTSLQPSDTLNWTPCYSVFQCTRLIVPFDYDVPGGDKAAIAIVRFPAQVSIHDPSYGGPLFFNPGGPGGSGVEFMIQDLPLILQELGPAANSFDLVSFDPRGVGVSTPSVSFFSTDADRSVWDFSANGQDVNSTTPALQIPRLWARSQALGYLAQARDNGIFAYVTTDNVARDMWAMVQAYNQTKLQYYGISYGTVIGATFATLFPDKIGRMIIDGVLDSQAYFSGDWAKELLTTDKDLQDFFDSCQKAGPEACAFYEPSSSKIAQRLNKLLDSVYKQPVPVHSNGTFGIVDYATVRQAVLGVLYNPYPGYSVLAPALAALENGDGFPIFELFGGPRLDQCNADSKDNSFDADVAISCGDALPNHDSATDLIKYYQENIHVSSFLNEFMRDRIVCSGYHIHHNGTFRGPVGGNTSFPILLIGNTADPVTPLAAAVKTSKAFPGSVVLTQDSPGHTSVAAPSTCTVRYIVEYIVNGTLPNNGTICPVDRGPFNTTSSSNLGARMPKAVEYARNFQLPLPRRVKLY